MYLAFGKRAMDFVIALFALVFLLPLLVVIAFSILFIQGRPVFFRQSRPGLNAQLFKMIKFCTMTEDRDAEGNFSRDADRLTWLGRLLRSTSLDELPELWNVLRGEMSLVGPRPLLAEYLGRYTEEQMRRHGVRPGITGWAQVNGRNTRSWEDRFNMDVWYVENHSFRLDLKILLLTIWQVAARKGISAHGHATMPRFTGASHSGSRPKEDSGTGAPRDKKYGG